MSINRATIKGNLGAKPEVFKLKSSDNAECVRFNVATNISYTARETGEVITKTEWHRVVVFKPHLVDYVKKHLDKGARVCVEGTLRTKPWTDENGQKHQTTEIQVAGKYGEVLHLVKPVAEQEQEKEEEKLVDAESSHLAESYNEDSSVAASF